MKIGRIEIAPMGAVELRWKYDGRLIKKFLERWSPKALRFGMVYALMALDKEYIKQIQGAINDCKKNLIQSEN